MLLTVVLVAVGLFLALALFLYFGQNKLLFIPSRTIDLTPDQLGLPYEDLFLDVAPGEQINAWYFPAQGSPASNGTVLFCHGNAGNISHRLQTVQFLLRLGMNVLIFDYRGYGRSDGEPSEDNVYADAHTAYDWLVAVKRVDPTDLYLFGRSLGGAVAIDLAVQIECAGIIVESSFTSTADMGRQLYPFMPITLLVRYRFDAVSKIGQLDCPVLVAHAPDDEMIPYDMGLALFERATSEKMFVKLEGGHNDLAYLDNAKYVNALRGFFKVGPSGHSEPGVDPEPGSGQID